MSSKSLPGIVPRGSMSSLKRKDVGKTVLCCIFGGGSDLHSNLRDTNTQLSGK